MDRVLFKSFQQSKQASCFTNSAEFDTERLNFDKKILVNLNIDNLVFDQRLQENTYQSNQAVLLPY